MSHKKKYFDPAQAESEQKDLVISQLKSELFDLKNNERDYNVLNAQLNTLQHKYAMLQEEKLKSDKERRLKNDQDQKQLMNIKEEIDILKSDIRNQNIDLQELRSDNNALNEMIQFRQQEIIKLRSEMGEIDSSNRRMQEDNISLNQNLRQLKEEKRNLVQDADQLTVSADQMLQKNRNLEKVLKNLQQENHIIEKNLIQLQKNNDHLNLEVRNHSDELNHLQQIQNENDKAQKYLENDQMAGLKQHEKTKTECLVNQDNYQLELNKGKELSSKIVNIETTIRSKELHIDDLRNNFEVLKQRHYHLLDENKELTQELEKSLNSAEDLNRVNKELLQEAEQFKIEDEKIRQMLDRKQQIVELISNVDGKVQNSMQSISHLLNKK